MLTPNCKHKHRVKFCDISVKRDLSAGTAAYHQPSEIHAHRSADQRISLQHVECFQNVAQAHRRILNLELLQRLKDTIKIVPDLWCQFDAQHDYRASVRGFGRATFLPAIRRSR